MTPMIAPRRGRPGERHPVGPIAVRDELGSPFLRRFVVLGVGDVKSLRRCLLPVRARRSIPGLYICRCQHPG
jgi:hypothetical protein